MSDSIKKLSGLFSKFPTVGQRTADRFVFYLLKLPKEKINELSETIKELNKIKFCNFCFQPFQPIFPKERFCSICSNLSRDRQMLCIVEKESDLISIEKTKKYKGLYFILGGVLDSRNTNANNLRLKELKLRLKNAKKISEVIIALNPTPEGRATSVLVQKAIKESGNNNLKISYLARGLPFGGELEYADEETLESAFEGRK